MREAFQRIAAEYRSAEREPLSGHPLARYIRDDAAAQVREALPATYQPFLVHGSPGVGNWAQIPWIAVFDPAVTESATRGYYVVYLFSADLQRVYLSLNQGTTRVHQEFGAAYVDELRRRSALMRGRLPEHQGQFSDAAIDLGSDSHLPRGYEAGHAFGRAYDTGDLPFDDEFAADLANIMQLYLQLRSRGGVLPLEDAEDQAVEEHTETITELRRYRLHRSIERNPSAGRKAKKVHGYVCQSCGFDFETVYGPAGREFIEAHHLTPLSELPEDTPVSLDPKEDFAVLCANCHRMMHRRDGPRTLSEIRTLARVGAVQAFHKGLRGRGG